MFHLKPFVARHLYLLHHKQERSEGELVPSQGECGRRFTTGDWTYARRENKLATVSQNTQATYRRLIPGTKLEYNTKLSWRILFSYHITKYNKQTKNICVLGASNHSPQSWKLVTLPTEPPWSLELSVFNNI